MSIVYLALGSNLGDREQTILSAMARLQAEPHLRWIARSSLYETAPIGGPKEQGAYLNAVVAVETSLTPECLLDRLLEIEQQFGRIRSERNAPRTLDLDILLYDDVILQTERLAVPHPRMTSRRFVLVPLEEIAGDIIHPIEGKSIRALRDALPLEDLQESVTLYRKTKVNPHIHTELEGMRALVTGSSSGIGRAIALELARAGAAVIVHGYRSRDAIHAVVREIRELGGIAEGFQADLRDPVAIGTIAKEGWDLWNGLDICINNAGADLLTTEAATWDFIAKWQALVAVDVTATMLLSRSIGERMASGRGGVLLTMGWDQAETGMEGESGQLFGAAKAAVMAFTKSLAKSLAPRVRVNCLAPGWIKTAWGEQASSTWQERVRQETPLQRWGLPADVAAAARWLCSPYAAFITGQIIRINGGAI